MIKLGIIGIGVMGSNHLRLAASMKDICEVVISDSDPDKIKSAEATYHVRGYTDYSAMLNNEKPDAVIIAVPTQYHKKIALDCLEQGAHIFVEKPIAGTLEDAEQIIAKAKEKNKLFTVGHVERFNPIVTQVKELIQQNVIGKPYLVKTIRVGPFPKRLYGMTGGVLVDLAVHDIDVIQYLIGPIQGVYAQLMVEGKQEIYSKVLLDIAGGIKGSCEFSWISPQRMREIEIYGEKGMFKCAYDKQTITFYENSDFSEDKKNIFQGGNIAAGKVLDFPVIRDEPLRRELQNFVKSVMNKEQLLVSPEQAKQALAIALAILKSGKENNIIKL